MQIGKVGNSKFSFSKNVNKLTQTIVEEPVKTIVEEPVKTIRKSRSKSIEEPVTENN